MKTTRRDRKIVACISLTCLLIYFSFNLFLFISHMFMTNFSEGSLMVYFLQTHHRTKHFGRICTDSNRTLRQLLCRSPHRYNSSSQFQARTEGTLRVNINNSCARPYCSQTFVCWCSYFEVWPVPGLSTGTLQLNLSGSTCCSIKRTSSIILSLCIRSINIISNIITSCFFV